MILSSWICLIWRWSVTFCEKSDCPKLVKEEFQESQREDERQKKGGPSGRGDEHDDDDEPLENPRGSQEDLFIEPKAIPEQYEQAEPYERLYGPIDIQAGEILDEDNQYDDAEFLKKAKLVNWHEDAKKLGLTSGAELKTLDKWLDEQVQTANLHRDLAATGGLPSDLNEKQFQAFAIVRNFLIEVRRKGVGNVPQYFFKSAGLLEAGRLFSSTLCGGGRRRFSTVEVSSSSAPHLKELLLTSLVEQHSIACSTYLF